MRESKFREIIFKVFSERLREKPLPLSSLFLPPPLFLFPFLMGRMDRRQTGADGQ
jgi:hypothetical protein